MLRQRCEIRGAVSLADKAWDASLLLGFGVGSKVCERSTPLA